MSQARVRRPYEGLCPVSDLQFGQDALQPTGESANWPTSETFQTKPPASMAGLPGMPKPLPADSVQRTSTATPPTANGPKGLPPDSDQPQRPRTTSPPRVVSRDHQSGRRR